MTFLFPENLGGSDEWLDRGNSSGLSQVKILK